MAAVLGSATARPDKAEVSAGRMGTLRLPSPTTSSGLRADFGPSGPDEVPLRALPSRPARGRALNVPTTAVGPGHSRVQGGATSACRPGALGISQAENGVSPRCPRRPRSSHPKPSPAGSLAVAHNSSRYQPHPHDSLVMRCSRSREMARLRGPGCATGRSCQEFLWLESLVGHEAGDLVEGEAVGVGVAAEHGQRVGVAEL